MSLTQIGNSVSGSVAASNSCIGGGKFTGTVLSDSLDASVTAGEVIVSVNGTVSSTNQIDGTYSLAAAGGCPADNGSFHMTR
jgi:hypothetical protein